MNHSLTTLKKAIHGFNERAFTAYDFRRLAKRENIRVDFWKLKPHIKGFYGLNRRYKVPVKYIVINQDLGPLLDADQPHARSVDRFDGNSFPALCAIL